MRHPRYAHGKLCLPETKGEDTHFRSDFSGIQQKLKVLDSGCHMRFAPGSHPVIRREDGTMWNY